MTGGTSGRTDRRRSDDEQRRSDDERLNDQFHTLLREAAEKREGRAVSRSTEDAVAAKQESADLLALARGQAPGRAPGQANSRTGHGPSLQSDSPAKVKRHRR
jgi:hypothetical protein